MSTPRVPVRELAGWPLDHYDHRPSDYDRAQQSEAQHHIAQRPPYQQCNPVLAQETAITRELLDPHISRSDLQAEMAGLDWTVGVVDLRQLLAFQRRLSFDPRFLVPTVGDDDWHRLIEIAFAPPKLTSFTLTRESKTFILESTDPNMQLRISNDPPSAMMAHSGSPFIEVASFNHRWFLRDGYHRAYSLLRAGISQVPAVIIHARTIEELGATLPRFFDEATLFSPTPPRVTDFLDDTLVLEYTRRPLIKTIRVTIEESLEPAPSSGDQL